MHAEARDVQNSILLRWRVSVPLNRRSRWEGWKGERARPEDLDNNIAVNTTLDFPQVCDAVDPGVNPAAAETCELSLAARCAPI